MVTFFDCCCRYSGGSTQSPNCWNSCNMQREMGEGDIDDDRHIVMEDESVVCM